MRVAVRVKEKKDWEGNVTEDAKNLAYADVRELTLNFEKNVMTLRFRDTSGEHLTHQDLAEVDDIDW